MRACGGEHTPSAVEPLVSPKASPMEKSARSQFSTTSKMALVSAMTSVATFAEKQSPSRSASAIACNRSGSDHNGSDHNGSAWPVYMWQCVPVC